MIDHVWTVLCSRSLVDVESQNISLLEVVDEISLAPELLAENKEVSLPIRLELVTCWRRSQLDQPGKSRGRMSLSGPDGKKMEEQSYNIDLSEFPRRRTRVRMPGLLISKPGSYVFRVEVQMMPVGQWMEVAKIPLDIVVGPSSS